MQFLIITSCTRRKKAGLNPPLTIEYLQNSDHLGLASQWIKYTENANNKISADQLYVGRSITEIKKAANFLNAQIYFASSGFGLIQSNFPIPNYDLTVSLSDQTICKKITEETFSPSKWWDSIKEIRGIKTLSELLTDSPNLTILLSLSKAYLELIKHELECIKKENTHQLRIFTSSENEKFLPDNIKSAYIPYDDRFDGVNSPNPGTRSDYPQRILRHFSESILDPTHLNLEKEKQKVLKMLSGMQKLKKVERARLNDDEIAEVMRKYWGISLGSSNRMLRLFRDDLHIACEQKRFANIFRTVKEDKVVNEGI